MVDISVDLMRLAFRDTLMDDLKVRMDVYIAQPGRSFSKYDDDGDISKLLVAVEKLP